MKKIFGEIDSTKLIMVLIFAVAIIYLLQQLIPVFTGEAEIAEAIKDVEVTGVFIILFIGVAALVALAIVNKSFALDRAGIITIGIVVVLIYLAMKYLFPQLGVEIFKTASMVQSVISP